MPIGLLNSQWLGQNASRAYPIVDWASRFDATETIQLPDSFLLYLRFAVNVAMAVEPEKFYVQALLVSPTGYTLEIGYNDGTVSPPTVAVTSVDAATHQEFRSYALVGVDDFDDSNGFVVIGRLVDVALLPPGRYTFDPADAYLEVDAIQPNVRLIGSLTVVNGAERSDPIYGDIELVARDNMRITVSSTEGEPTQIAFSAIRGEGLNEDCGCPEADVGDPIRFIDGIPPDAAGNFKIIGDACLKVDPIANGLQLTDECSKPCCGCAELTALQNQLDRFRDGEATLRTFATNLLAVTSQLGNAILSSRLGGRCVES